MMGRQRKYSDELRERAVRHVFETQRPIAQVAEDLGIHKEALRLWVRQAEADAGTRTDLLSTNERAELKRLREEVAVAKKAAEAGTAFQAAIALAGEGKNKEAEDAFAKLAADGTSSYRMLAKYREAAEVAQSQRQQPARPERW